MLATIKKSQMEELMELDLEQVVKRMEVEWVGLIMVLEVVTKNVDFVDYLVTARQTVRAISQKA